MVRFHGKKRKVLLYLRFVTFSVFDCCQVLRCLKEKSDRMYYGRVLTSLLAATVVAAETPRIFVDDLGVKHEFTGKPKVVAWSALAVSLFHVGKFPLS
jgi:hypothetical protein